MFDTLFGEGQYGLKMLFAFIVVFGLLALALWLVRRFSGERVGNPAARGRQPRLAVIDAATVDGRRRLVLIRRDNVEHLLIIGGPTDVVIEQNILRAAAATREAPAARPPAATDPLPRAVPLGEGSMWPLQPEPSTRLEPSRAESAPRPQRPPAAIEENMQWSESDPSPHPQAPPLPPRERRSRAADPLAGLAAELARAPAPADAAPVDQPGRPTEQTLRPPARRVPRPQPVPPASGGDAELSSAADHNLAEMAHRLEAALRRPAPVEEGRAAPAAPNPVPAASEGEKDFAPAPPTLMRTDKVRPLRPEAPPVRSEGKPPPQKSLYDSLEQEMASLLGRPGGKV